MNISFWEIIKGHGFRLTCMKWTIVEQGFESDSVSKNESIYKNSTFINELWLVIPTHEIIIKATVVAPIVLWGVFGNILLLYVIIRNKCLRSPTNLLIGNMAAADLLTLLIIPEVFLMYDFFQNYQLGKFGCRAEGGVECAILLAGVFNLVAISYDRLNAIVLPQENRLSRRGAKIIMVMAWIIGFIAAIPLFMYREYKERQWLNFLEKYCTENMMVTNIYWHVIITMMVWFPLGVMLVCYIALFMKLHDYEKAVIRKGKNASGINVSYKKRVAKMMCTVVITFMVCRIPLTILIFYRAQLLRRSNISHTQQVQNQVNGFYYATWLTSRYLILINAAINPIIYGLTNEKFRKAIKATKMMKWFEHNSQNAKKSKIKIRSQQNNTNNSVKKVNIFLIFKNKLQNKTLVVNETTSITDSTRRSNAPILKK